MRTYTKLPDGTVLMGWDPGFDDRIIRPPPPPPRAIAPLDFLAAWHGARRRSR